MQAPEVAWNGSNDRSWRARCAKISFADAVEPALQGLAHAIDDVLRFAQEFMVEKLPAAEVDLHAQCQQGDQGKAKRAAHALEVMGTAADSINDLFGIAVLRLAGLDQVIQFMNGIVGEFHELGFEAVDDVIVVGTRRGNWFR